MNRSYRLVSQLNSPELQRFLSNIHEKTLLLHRSPNPLVLKHYRGSVNGFAATTKSTLTEGRRGLHSLHPAKDSSPPESDRRRGGLPKDLSRSVMHLTCESSAGNGVCDVYLIGTLHASLVSCMEVEVVIRYLKPQVVFLELCRSRVAKLAPPDSKVVNKLGVALASEFRVAYKEAMKYGAHVILGDRPVKITLMRTIGKMPFWHKIKLIGAARFPSLFFSGLEDLRKKEICDIYVTTYLQELAEEFPTLSETIINERDRYMSSILLRIAREHTLIVAVVGKGHLAGMKKHWKQPVAMKDLLSIPFQYSTISAAKFMKKFGVAVA